MSEDEDEMMGLVKGDLTSFISYLVEVLGQDDARRNRMMKDTQAVTMMQSHIQRIDKHLYLYIK